MLFDQIKSDLIIALKGHDETVVSALRFLLSEINNFVNSKYPPSSGGLPKDGVPDADVISILQKQIKTHRESIEAFKKGNRTDLVSKEEKELAILQKYLPEQMSEEEIRKIVLEIKTSMGYEENEGFGKLMKEVMEKVKSKADGKLVAEIVKEYV